jgi:RNA-binding protein
VVQVGKEGATPALVAAVKSALDIHELIKVRLGENAEGDRHELAASIANSSESELVEQLGRTLLLYRRHPNKPKIALAPENEKRKKRAAVPASETERKPAGGVTALANGRLESRSDGSGRSRPSLPAWRDCRRSRRTTSSSSPLSRCDRASGAEPCSCIADASRSNVRQPTHLARTPTSAR